MNETVDRRMAGGRNLGGETLRRAFVFHIADKNGFAGQQRLQRFLPRLGADGINDLGALLFQRPRDVPGDAFAIGDTEHDKGLSSQLKKIRHTAKV